MSSRQSVWLPDDALAKPRVPPRLSTSVQCAVCSVQCARQRQPWLQPSSAPDSWDAVLYSSMPNKATRGFAGVAAPAESSHRPAICQAPHRQHRQLADEGALDTSLLESQFQSHLHTQKCPIISNLAHACGSVVALLHVVSSIN